MKKMFAILSAIFVLNFGVSQVDAAVAIGKAPSGTIGAQARILAKRAAQVVALKDNGGKNPKVIAESWDEKTG